MSQPQLHPIFALQGGFDSVAGARIGEEDLAAGNGDRQKGRRTRAGEREETARQRGTSCGCGSVPYTSKALAPRISTWRSM
jgi:hypothetical protein